jgi:hypothetical protein
MAKKEKVTTLYKISSESVLKHTDRNWDEWIQILDEQGARQLTHKDIVAFLVKKYKLTKWWRQWVATCYEVHIGRKIEGQNSKGQYATVATKSLDIEQKKLWAYLTSEAGQKVWLKPLGKVKLNLKEQFEVEGGYFCEIRTMKTPQRLRFTWQDPDWEKSTVVQLLCHQRPNGKTMLGIQHEKLMNLRLKKQMLDYWKEILQAVEKDLQN